MRRISRIILALALLVSGFATVQPVVAKDNPKVKSSQPPKEAQSETPKSSRGASKSGESTIPKSSEAPAPSSSTSSTTAKEQPKNVKPAEEVEPDKKATKVEKAETVTDVNSTQTSACKAAAKAKKKVEQNLCYDFIVLFQPGLARGNSDKLLSDSNAQKIREFSNIFNGALVNGPLAKMQALAKNPNVLVVEDDMEVKATTIESPAPWGLDRIDQNALPVNNTYDDQDQTGTNTFAYVVDTGIDKSNGDFEGRVTAGFTAVLDGNGSNDCNGHGTHVAGTIGGKMYGVAKNTTLVPVRVLDCTGSGSYSSVISGLDWIAANYQPGQAAVVNMSLGGPASSTLDGAVRNLIAKGVTVVVAAGNSAADACNYSPSRVLEAITIGATTNTDARASYSNFGSCVDLFAPGSAVTSTWLGASGTNTISGTSMATPHVTGAVARFIGFNVGLTPGQVANSVIGSATSGVVIGAGTNSPNKLLYAYITPDTTTAVPVDTSPTFKKVIPRGKKK